MAVGALLVVAVVSTAAAFGINAARSQAQANFQTSEANFQMAREAVDLFYTRVSEDKLLNEPQMERLRKELLEAARAFYQKFVARRRGDPQPRYDLGWALLAVSRIERELGALAQSIEHVEASRTIFAALAAAQPESAVYLEGLGHSLIDMGVLYLETGRAIESETAYVAAVDKFVAN